MSLNDLKFTIADTLILISIAPFALIMILITTLLLVLINRQRIFFVSKRVGRNLKIFRIYKFRTMINEAPLEETNASMEQFVTPFGRILRSSSLDEMPQILNVFLRTMSFVGPRPCFESQHDLIEERSKNGILDITPGITGLAQVKGRDSLSLRHKVKYERFYEENKSLRLYFYILAVTACAVLTRRGLRY